MISVQAADIREDKMKAVLLMLLLLWLPLIVMGNSAYPFDIDDPPRFLSELWFADNGHLMAEFAGYHLPAGDSCRIYFTHEFYNPFMSGYLYLIPSDARILDIPVPTYENPQVVDVSVLLPDISFNIEEDSVCFALAAYPMSEHTRTYWNHTIRWSDNIENHYNLKPLQSGQSYAWLDYHTWVKDAPPTPGTNLFQPVKRSVVKIRVTDQDNHPVPYVNQYDMQMYAYLGTDLNGEIWDAVYAGRYYLLMLHPITNAIICNQDYWVEPFDTLLVPIQIDMPSEYPYTDYRGLRAYPSPLNLKDHNYIQFRYYGKVDTKNQCYIKIYNAKGRYITREYISGKGFSHWHPPADIASGIYIAQMISGNKIMDAVTFTILK